MSILRLFLAGCSSGQSSAPAETPYRILTPTATAVLTVAPTPTPEPITGIDAPIVAKDISAKQVMIDAQRLFCYQSPWGMQMAFEAIPNKNAMVRQAIIAFLEKAGEKKKEVADVQVS